eukprot:m.1209369 g.1209369  ORF g.1209369 m.1209369 type:complete len:282 (+) comp24591_c1_seq10:1547-2392(+)
MYAYQAMEEVLDWLQHKFSPGCRQPQLLSLPHPCLHMLLLVHRPPNLKSLFMGQNKLTVLPVDFGCGLRQLEALNISGNLLRSLPFSIAFMKRLREMDVSGNQIHTVTDGIAGLHSLERLYMRDNKVTRLPAALGALVRLQFMDFARNSVDLNTDDVYTANVCQGSQNARRLLWKQLSWAPHIHFACAQPLCDAIKTTLLCAQRRAQQPPPQHTTTADGNAGTLLAVARGGAIKGSVAALLPLPYLPPEIWELIFRQLGRDLSSWERLSRHRDKRTGREYS